MFVGGASAGRAGGGGGLGLHTAFSRCSFLLCPRPLDLTEPTRHLLASASPVCVFRPCWAWFDGDTYQDAVAADHDARGRFRGERPSPGFLFRSRAFPGIVCFSGHFLPPDLAAGLSFL